MSRSKSRTRIPPATPGALEAPDAAQQPPEAIARAGNGSGDDSLAPSARRAIFERAAFVAVLIVAGLLRLVDLGRRPLQIEEADLALRSWALSQGHQAHLAGEALIVNSNTAMLFLFGGDDGIVRLLPALAGIGLVALVWPLRYWLGTTGAIAAAAFLAISPTTTYFSRLTSSSIVVVTLVVALVAILSAYARQPRTWLVFAGAVVVGLLAMAGPLVWSALIALVAAAIAHVLLATRTTARGHVLGLVAASWRPTTGIDPSGRLLPPTAVRQRAVAVAIGVAAIVATGLATNPSGIQSGFVDSIAAWWDVATSSSDWPLWYHLAYLFSYDAPALLVGVPAAIALSRRRYTWAQFVALWALASFLIAALTRRDPAGALLIVVPLLILAGALVDRFGTWLQSRDLRVRAGFHLAGATILAGFSWVAVANRTLVGAVASNALRVNGSSDPTIVGALLVELTALAPLFGAIALTVVSAYLLGHWRTIRLSSVTVAALSTAIALHATFNLNFATTGLSPLEMVATRATSPDVRNLRADVDLVQQVLFLRQREHDVVVESQFHPLLSWYLKDLENVRFADDVVGSPAIAIASSDADPPPGTYLAQRYQLVREAELRLPTWADWVRWWVIRDANVAQQATTVIVYVRS